MHHSSARGVKADPAQKFKAGCGKPLVAHAIEIALNANLFRQVIVSTDDPEIKSVSQKYGALVPFLRSQNLADDHTGTVPVIVDMAHNLCLNEDTTICCLYPAALMIKPHDLSAGLDLVHKGGYDFAMAVTKSPSHPGRTFVIKDARLQSHNPDLHHKRSQDLETHYYDSGQFYFAKLNTWQDFDYSRHRVAPVVLPKTRAVDIDWPEDLELAEILYARYR